MNIGFIACLLMCLFATFANGKVPIKSRLLSVNQVRGGKTRIQQSFPTITEYDYQPSSSTAAAETFLNRYTRRDFINKVYGIFGSQIFTTMIVSYLIMTNNNINSIVQSNEPALLVSSFLVSMGSLIGLQTNSLKYKYPQNFILLAIFTLAESLTVGIVTSHYNPMIVLTAAMHTLTAFCGITLYSLLPNAYDLTASSSMLITTLLSLLTGSILNIFFQIPLLNNLLSGFGAMLFSLYILHDTQKIIGGTHKKQFSPQDYIQAALNLYVDVISLFMEILKIIAKINNEEKQRGGGENNQRR